MLAGKPLQTDAALRDLARTYGLSLIVLFGSTARGARKPESDVDIGLLFSSLGSEVTLELESSVAQALWRLWEPRCELDVVVLNRAGALMKRNVAIFGIPLFTLSSSVWRSFRLRAFREFEDGERFRRRRQLQTLRRLSHESHSGRSARQTQFPGSVSG